MKIGIFTFHSALNYGAMLQAYALQTELLTQGHDAYIIDYRPKNTYYTVHTLNHWLSMNPLKLLHKLLAEPFLYKKRDIRWKNFESFSKRYHRLFPYKKNFKGEDFDLLLFGSDQIWNKCLTGNSFDPVFWGNNFICPCASYAASMGWYQPIGQEYSEISKLLGNFKAISVRESSLMEQLVPLTNIPINVCCDPVFLLGDKEWTKISTPIYENKPYVLLYNLMGSKECRSVAEMICKEKGYDLKEIVGEISYKNSSDALQIIGPSEFISYFKSAAYVVTSSYHGTAFSLIFNKNFYSVGFKFAGDRIYSLLSLLKLEDRMHAPIRTSDIHPIDYSGINGLLSEYIRRSKNYIKNLYLLS